MRTKKVQQIAIVFQRPFERCPQELTPRVADHFVEWMSNPPVVFFAGEQGVAGKETSPLNRLAGELAESWHSLLMAAQANLLATIADRSLWELYVKASLLVPTLCPALWPSCPRNRQEVSLPYNVAKVLGAERFS